MRRVETAAQILNRLDREVEGLRALLAARVSTGGHTHELGLREVVTFTAGGSFTKAAYPWLRAVRVRLVGGGGGSGGAQNTAPRVGAGGGGAGYAESLILVSDLDDSEAVTVGAGGSAGSGITTNGGVGGDSVFDTISGEVRGEGGGGGNHSGTSGGRVLSGPGAGGGGTGDLVIPGEAGFHGYKTDTDILQFGYGGASHLSGQQRTSTTTSGSNGFGGLLYGGGASGGFNHTGATARNGGAGSVGIVVVELYG